MWWLLPSVGGSAYGLVYAILFNHARAELQQVQVADELPSIPGNSDSPPRALLNMHDERMWRLITLSSKTTVRN